MRKLPEPPGNSGIRSLSAQELDLVGGGTTKITFPGGSSWSVHDDGFVVLRMPGRPAEMFGPGAD